MTGPELDLLEGGGRGWPTYCDPGGRIDFAATCENARLNNGDSMRPWASFIITSSADYVSNLAVRARFLARGIHQAGFRYQRYYQMQVPR